MVIDRERADVALLAALDAALPDGLSAGELAARVGRSRAWVFSRRDLNASAGRAVRLRRGDGPAGASEDAGSRPASDPRT